MRHEWLEVVNVKKLINFSRKIIYHNFDEENNSLSDTDFLKKVDGMEESNEEMDTILPFGECKAIFQPYLVRVISKHDVYFKIKEDDYDEVLVQLNKRMVSNIVKDLVNKGMVESAFDNDKNDFVFWVKQDEKDSDKN